MRIRTSTCLSYLFVLVALSSVSGVGAQVLNWFQPAASPGPRCCMGMAYDEADSYTLLFGGVQGYYSTLGDTWKLAEGGWFQLAPAASPPAREGPGMAYDAATGTVVLFGGSSALFGGGCCDLNDTWIWDGTTWTQAFPATSPPGRRFDGQGMAYDAGSQKVVLFGGTVQGNTYLGDTWTWDGVARTWTQQFPATSPSPRNTAIVHGGATGRVVLFGGSTVVSNVVTNVADTWVWNGTTWRQRLPATSPPARSGHAMAFDPQIKKVVLFGGFGNTDTWTWDGTNWTQITPATTPPDRYAFNMVYDRRAQSAVMFGGFSFCCDIQRDTWKLSVGP